jgi:hypothetical protein
VTSVDLFEFLDGFRSSSTISKADRVADVLTDNVETMKINQKANKFLTSDMTDQPKMQDKRMTRPPYFLLSESFSVAQFIQLQGGGRDENSK